MAQNWQKTDALVTQATSGENPSIWFFSRSKTDWETNMGKYEFCTPSSLISVLNQPGYMSGRPLNLMLGQTLNLFPDAVRPRLQDVATTDAVIVQHICFEQDLSIAQSCSIQKLVNNVHWYTRQRNQPLSSHQ